MDVTILVVDDEKSQRLILSGDLKSRGYNVLEADSVDVALSHVMKNRVDIILSDLKMPGASGIDLVNQLKQINPEIAVVIMTAYASVETAVLALKQGAYDFITKPYNLDEVELVIKRILEKNNLVSENKILREQLESGNKLEGIVTASLKMQKILDVVGRVAASKASVLILGESGTGKEVLARAIHFASKRKDKLFIPVNCAALNENLLESELFGHEKGSFTGAEKQHRGRFEIADEGTIFLDEIGDLPLHIQVKLLRVLQEEQFERVGGSSTINVDVRVIAATNKNIEELIKEGKFREDLYYRLNVVNINLPPLRERKEDITLLISTFINKYKSDSSKPNLDFSKEALDILMKYNYPGNIRELENIVHHSIVLSRNEIITTDDLPLGIRKPRSENDLNSCFDESSSLPEKVECLERKMVNDALHQTNGNQSAAAKLLGISERNLRYRLEKWGLKNKG
ncbi:MAG: sigma-54 dependent transcriptional regulator [Ignavibacteriota bacterium]|nr:sigma-54 dependent transcriptional regulator [Ignavibacteriota bacterium]